MNTQDTQGIITVMQAFVDGQGVECISKDASHGNWQEASSPMWDWRNYNYRIAHKKIQLYAYLTNNMLVWSEHFYTSGNSRRVPSEDKMIEVES